MVFLPEAEQMADGGGGIEEDSRGGESSSEELSRPRVLSRRSSLRLQRNGATTERQRSRQVSFEDLEVLIAAANIDSSSSQNGSSGSDLGGPAQMVSLRCLPCPLFYVPIQ